MWKTHILFVLFNTGRGIALFDFQQKYFDLNWN